MRGIEGTELQVGAHHADARKASYRYSVGLVRRIEPNAEGLHERIQLQAANATEALLCARHVTGAIAVFDAERLGEVAS